MLHRANAHQKTKGQPIDAAAEGSHSRSNEGDTSVDTNAGGRSDGLGLGGEKNEDTAGVGESFSTLPPRSRSNESWSVEKNRAGANAKVQSHQGNNCGQKRILVVLKHVHSSPGINQNFRWKRF